MNAKHLESIIATECRHTGISARSSADVVQRFQKLRDFGLLSKNRGKNALALSSLEIAASLLSVVSCRPGFAGVTAKNLLSLRPVGDRAASFFGSATFGEAVAALFEDKEALESLLEVRATGSEIAKNGHGRGTISYLDDKGKPKAAFYVSGLALTLMGKGAEKTYNPRSTFSNVIVETVFIPRLFKNIARELERERRHQAMLDSLAASSYAGSLDHE